MLGELGASGLILFDKSGNKREVISFEMIPLRCRKPKSRQEIDYVPLASSLSGAFSFVLLDNVVCKSSILAMEQMCACLIFHVIEIFTLS